MESSLQSMHTKAFTFSVVGASPLEVVQVLCKYLELKGCSECRPCGVAEELFRWQKTLTIFIDFVPLLIDIQVEGIEGDVTVTIHDLSLNDVIRCKKMCNDVLKFVNGRGFGATCAQPAPQSFRLLDDDFDMIIENEMHCCSEKVAMDSADIDACKYDFSEKVDIESTSTDIDDIDSVDIDLCKCDFPEEALEAVSCWSTSKVESGCYLAEGLAENTISITALIHLVDVVDKRPPNASLQGFAM
jgi:hypothetical protein